MNRPQRIALDHYCLLATETAHPRFSRIVRRGLFSVVLTVNAGHE